MNPVEVVKTRLQIQGELDRLERERSTISKIYGRKTKYRGFLRGAVEIFRDEGIRGFYKGIIPSGLRESSYAALRLALYDPIKSLLGESRSTSIELALWKKLIAGATSGGIGAAIANPTDVLKVRMQAEGPHQLKRYRSTWDGFRTIWKEEGIRGFYKGVSATTQRAMLLSAAMLPSYDHSKRFFLRRGWIRKDALLAHVW